MSPTTPRRRRALVVAVASLLAVLAALVGAGVAVAEWQTSGPGTSTARAGAITAPTGVTAAAPACTGTTGSVRFSWTAPPGAVTYQLEIASNATFTQGVQSGSTANTSATASQQNATTQRTIYFRVRAVAGSWVSANSAVVSRTIGPCSA